MIGKRHGCPVATHTPAPNPRLTEMVANLTAGDALDLGSGNGGDTLWLASQGWSVTAFDSSQSAIDRLVRLARVTGLGDRISATRRDLRLGLPNKAFDLVNAHYLHASQPFDRSALFHVAAQLLRPGGHLLIVDHGSIAPWSWNQDPHTHFPSPREVHAEIGLDPAGWNIVRADKGRRNASGPGGRTAEVVDHILVIRRTLGGGN